MTITKICKECGNAFESPDNRRAYCLSCLANSNSPRMRQKRYSKKYVAKRRATDPEFRKRLSEQANKSHKVELEKQFRQKAIQITKIGQDIDALTKYLVDNFQMRHK